MLTADQLMALIVELADLRIQRDHLARQLEAAQGELTITRARLAAVEADTQTVVDQLEQLEQGR